MNRAILLSVLVVCAVASVADGETRIVPADYADIQTAIDTADDGDTVLVLPGVYFERINFQGKDITVTSTDPDDPRIVGYTVLSGEDHGSVVTFANGETNAAVLAGFTILGGTGTRIAEFETETGARSPVGGGVHCFRASPTITKNVIARNTMPFNITGPTEADLAISCGGGIGAYDCAPIITYNTVKNNSAYAGGGIFCYYGEPTLHNNVIAENAGYIGGGLFTLAGAIYNNTIVANDASLSDGGGGAGNLYIVLAPDFGYTRFFNNIVANAKSGSGIYWQGDTSFGIFAYNDIWGNLPSNFFESQDLIGVNGNISEDPLFKAAINRDYHLTLESPAINAGDPDFIPPADQTDIEGNARVYGLRTDMGAYEYSGYVKPVAWAGKNVHILDPSQAVTLDGSKSFFYDPDTMKTYQWRQVSGPNTVLDDPTSATPTFTPPEQGEYVFELTVADDKFSSAPDQVVIFIGPNRLPVAHAGEDMAFQTPARAWLDGSGSYDPDPVDELTYVWTQVEGPPVTLGNADAADAYFEAEPGAVYVFELIVSDGIATSEPSQVRLVALGGTSDVSFLNVESIGNPYVHYADVSGTKVVGATDTATSLSWRIAYRDVQSGETETFSVGGINTHPKIDGDLVVWSGGATVTDTSGPPCLSVLARDLATGQQVTLMARSETESSAHPAVSGNRVVWVQYPDVNTADTEQYRNSPYDICGADVTDLAHPIHFTIASNVGTHDPFPRGHEMTDFDDVVDISGNIVVWEGNGDIFAADISDLADIKVFTVCHDPARQYDPAVSGDYVVWTDLRNDDPDVYGADISDPQNVRVFAVAKGGGLQSQPAIDGAVVLYLEGSENGGPIRMAAITRNHGVLIPRQPDVTYGVAPALDGSTAVCLSGIYGPIRGARVTFGYSVFDGAFENLATGDRYDYLRHAVLDARAGGVIVVPEGIHRENIDFAGNAVTVRSADPNDPAVVAATILEANGQVVTFASGEGADSVLEGLTICGGNRGIFCSESSPTIRHCTIEGHRNSGIRMLNRSKPTLIQCSITGNGGDGVEMRASGAGRSVTHNVPVLNNCLIAGNRGAGLASGQPTLENCTIADNLKQGMTSINATLKNCIVYFNNPTEGVQIASVRVLATYCDIQGGWYGDGNIDADPAFVQSGHWDGGVWLPGDYHLRSQGWRWDSGAGDWTSDAVTSPCIDAGDPASPLRDEPTALPQGAVANERVNMGVYGGTAEASVAPTGN
ncbi:MAG: right-handed parallel beta-helix repeat-containing protein [Sedimentisphaerales bacterium]|nr:right-handed parallel beta-helix repeat-containing protein [Sedimentisphaerales bacterium]